MVRNILGAALLTTFLACNAQIVERTRPAEWDSLIEGGRFMDCFMSMPEGKTEIGVWGTDSVKGRYVDNGIERPDISFWGGNVLKGKDGRFHLFVCGWPENSPGGHHYWPQSTVFHAVSERVQGPYSIVNTIGPGHNPEAFRLKDGRIVVYVIGSYYISDNENDLVWLHKRFDFDTRDRKIIEGLSNLTFTARPDGSQLMVCRGGGVWVSEDGLSPYMQLTHERIYPPVKGEFEDPVVWRDELQYHLIVNDWLGRIAFYERSLDGVNWVVEEGEAYAPGIAVHSDGSVENWFKFERMKVFRDEFGRPEYANFAVIDTLKNEDKPSDRHSSKNLFIPLKKGMRMEVIGASPLDRKNKKFKVRIKAEKDFSPCENVDVKSLVFGSHENVNFGRGFRAAKSYSDGNDLIVEFSGKGDFVRAGDFAPKVIGRDNDGEMIYGYVRVPWVDYSPAILSARRPVVSDATGKLTVEVANYGLSPSKPNVVLQVYGKDGKAGECIVPSLSPYESRMLEIKATATDEIVEVRFVGTDGKTTLNKFSETDKSK